MMKFVDAEELYRSRSGKIRVIKNRASRQWKSRLSGEVHEAGEWRITVITPNYKNGMNYTVEEYFRLCDEVAEVISNGSDYNSVNTCLHSLRVTASRYAWAYFASVGFISTACNAQNRRYILADEQNGFRSGHVISTILEEGFKVEVIINGEAFEVHSHEEFDTLTKKYH